MTDGYYISDDGTLYVVTDGNPAPNFPLLDESDLTEEAE